VLAVPVTVALASELKDPVTDSVADSDALSLFVSGGVVSGGQL
jgi:hypothetical protein